MNLFCVRTEYGSYTKHFIEGGYIGIGWLSDSDLSAIDTKDKLYPIYKKGHPNDTSNVVIGQQVGQIARFLLEIKPGDYVITPSAETDYIFYGIVQDNPYFYSDTSDGCPYRHRKKVEWIKNPIQRAQFSVPFQQTIMSSLTVFHIKHLTNFLSIIGKSELISEEEKQIEYNYYKSILNRILQLDAKEFELLITDMLSSLGFEGSEHTGKSGDGGVDAIGELNISNMAKIKIFVQAKRYNLDARINANVVKALRANIPNGGQGVFITTADFQEKAKEIAVQLGFPRIGLINGEQLVDILADCWDDIRDEFKEKLNLKLGLVIN